MLYYNLGEGGRGWHTVSWAKHQMGADAYICCPGPSLRFLHIERGRGRKIFAVNSAWQKTQPDIWVGVDEPKIHDPQIWGEPFVKVCNGAYCEHEIEGRKIKYYDNVFFSDFVIPKNGETLFNFLNHEDKLVWRKNSFAAALHLVIKMGAKTVYLVGCDLGGDSDYYHDKVLTEDDRRTSRRLYSQLISYINMISTIAKKRGIHIISCTPGSPINKFLKYKELSSAILESEVKVASNREALSGV